MNIGTVDIIEDIEETKKAISRPRSGSGSGGGKNNGGGGGNGPSGDDREEVDDRDFFTDKKSKILTWFVLVVVIMTFGGLLSAYVVIATNKVDEWRPFALPIELWLSTAIIALSSLAYSLGNRATMSNDQPTAKKWFLVTGGLGIAFVMSQIFAWIAISMRGMVLQGNPYAGFFYMLTIVHALHVLGGLIALGSVIYRSWLPTSDVPAVARRQTLSTVVGWYWHFMGALWVVLFIFLGFWK